MAKISVIIPVYNVEVYLPQCLESVINQTYTDMEILCIDDCSTDHSMSVLETYQQKDSRIEIFQNEKNGGLAYTRNVGIQRATGEYVLFVDSDDMIVPDLLESCMKVAAGSDMVCFDYQQVTGDNTAVRRQYAYKMKDGIYSGESYFVESIHTGSIIFSAWSKLFRRQFLSENHILFYDGILYEDMLFGFQCFINARKVYSLNCQLYIYRIRETSIMTLGISGKNIESYVISICELMKLYLQNDFSPEMNQAVEGYIRKVNREYVSAFRKWGKQELKPDLLKDKPEYLKLYRTFSELFIMPGKQLHISPGQVEKIRQHSYIILYGAGDIARSTIEKLDQFDISINGIAVSSMEGNKKSLLGNPIREIQDYCEIRDKCLVLIGTVPRYYHEIHELLQEKGFMEWMDLVEDYDEGEYGK